MKTNKIVCLISMILLFSLASNAQRRIIGGQKVDISQHPYQAAVIVTNTEKGTSNFGGGVIINNNWILTAAHVVYGAKISNIKVSTGNNNPLADLYTRSVERVIIYDGYEDNNDMDVALLMLSKPLTFGTNVQPISISQTTSYSDNTLATVSGWGRTSFSSTLISEYLKEADVTIKTKSNVFLTSSSSNHSYKGDSGGPLTISTSYGDKLIGIVKGCTGNAPNITNYYANVGYYYNWIYKIINSNTIVGDDFIDKSAEYTVNINGDYTVKTDGVLTSVTKNGRKVTVSAKASGAANIYVYIDGNLIAQKNVWVGTPIILGVYVDGAYFRLYKSRNDQHITTTNWTIGNNQYSCYDDFIYNPYASSGNPTSQEIKITVTATNKYGTSKPYSTTVTYSSSSRLTLSRNGNSNVFNINNQSNAISTLENNVIDYQLVNARKGTVIRRGKVNSYGGELNFNAIPKGLYLLKLTNKGIPTKTFKITIK